MHGSILPDHCEPACHVLQVDERVTPVIIINAKGVIQMASKLSCDLFGYTRGELENKNVAG